MSYFTSDTLLSYRNQQAPYLVERRQDAAVAVFLSHSHKDKDLVLGLVRFLGMLGIRVYVDWNDSSMPRVTDRTTAEKLKDKIHECDLVLVMATKNGVESRWVPWEVGIADKDKGEERILIWPVEDPTHQYKGNEYLQLYRTIEPSGFRDAIVVPTGFGVRQPLLERMKRFAHTA